MRTFIIATTAAAALFSFPAFTQDLNQGNASFPDFSGLWANPYLYGIEPPLSGPWSGGEHVAAETNPRRRWQALNGPGSPTRQRQHQIGGRLHKPDLEARGGGGR